jgi:hypothetical protein
VRPIRIVVLSILCALLAASLAACGPDAPPDVYRGSECPLSAQIQEAWAGTGDEHWAVDVAIRESHCQPEARNPSGASGVFQLMLPLHSRLFGEVCLGGADVWWDADCNIAAARLLYDGSGRRPWNF